MALSAKEENRKARAARARSSRSKTYNRMRLLERSAREYMAAVRLLHLTPEQNQDVIKKITRLEKSLTGRISAKSPHA